MIPAAPSKEESKEIAWGSPLSKMEGKHEFVIPKTLGEAIMADTPNVIVVQREEIKKDLQDLKDWAEDCYSLIATFSDVNHAQGLAMHKIATICNKVKQLQNKYK